MNQQNVFDKYGVVHYLSCSGLATNKNYRQRGIATEFFKARDAILRAFKLSVTSTLYTVIGSQKAALKANYYQVFSIKYTDLGEKFQRFDFSKRNCELCQVLDYKI